MSDYIVCVDDLEKSYYRYTDIQPETVFGHRLRGEIVRCRDCKHYHTEINGCDEFGDIWHDEYANVEPNGFCAWGERNA